MKKISLILFLLTGLLLNSHGQNFNVQSAYRSLNEGDYVNAKKYIDLATENSSTMNQPKMWYYRAKIYLGISTDAASKQLDPDAAEKAVLSFVNCVKTDTKKDWADSCNAIMWISGLQAYNKAFDFYQKKDYPSAIRVFSSIFDVFPNDKDNNLKRNNITPDILRKNLYFATIAAHDTTAAKEHLQKLIDAKFNEPLIYMYMSQIQLGQKDTSAALATIQKGRKLHEENALLINEEIRLYILQGKTNELLAKLSETIEQSPDNENLYYNRGLLYDNKKDFEKAAEDYKKAIELKSDYFEANYNLGVLYFNQAADMVNAANSIKSNDDYEKQKVKFNEKFKTAAPYLEKSVELNPGKSEEDLAMKKWSLNSLKQLYVRIGEMEKYNKIKAELEK